MRDFTVHCSTCDSEVKIRGKYLYMKCMCNEDIRILRLEDIISMPRKHDLYVLETKKGNSYAPLELTS